MGTRSPRLLWLLPVAAAILAGVVTVQARVTRQHEAAAEITRLGGKVQTTQGGPSWLRNLVGHRLMSGFDRATVVNLGGTETTDADLELLGGLRDIERLNLARTQVTDDRMAAVGRLTGLKALDVGGTQVTDEGLAHLAGLEKLEFLYLEDTAVTNAGVAHLEHLHNLRTLAVERTAVTEVGVEKLGKMLPGLSEVRRVPK